ncbi:MAG: hypothetical protein G8237_09265 [Magnetococcales bacterium]|nr:AsmA-like C-terminal domain-containing protein [Magnetococcales bacterium]NGZ06533.1 hypothetical protein [Magnetococcales bacterium]
MSLVYRIFKMVFGLLITLLLMLGAAGAAWTYDPPDLTPYVDHLARFLSDRSGFQVQLTGVELKIDWTPVIIGQGITILDPESGHPVLSARRLELRIDLQWDALPGLPVALTLDQVQGRVRRAAAGGWYLGNHPLIQPTDGRADGADWVVLHTLIARDARLSWEDETVLVAGQPVRLDLTDFQATATREVSGAVHVRMEARFPTSGEDTRIGLEGTRSVHGEWSAHLEVTEWRLAPLLPYLAAAPPLNGLTTPIRLDVRLTGSSLESLRVEWGVELGAGHLAWPQLFRWPLPITRLAAKGDLTHAEAGWDLRVAHFALRSVHGEAQGQFSLTGLAGPGSPYLDLTANASGNPANQAKFYYPTPIMDPALVNWLDHALQNGRVQQARATIRGHLANMPAGPKDPPEDRFHIEADVTGVELHYFPPLLPLTHATTHLVFDRYSFMAQIADATYGGTRQVKGEVRIADMVHHPVVEIQAESPHVELQSVWKEIVSHPHLRWDEAIGMAGAVAHGSGQANLKITLPLQAMSTLTYSGRLEMKQAGFKPPFLSQPLMDAHGWLNLDADRLEIQLASGRLDLWPLSGQAVVRNYRSPTKAHFTARLETRLEPAQLAEWAAPLLGEEGWIQGAVPTWLEFNRLPGQEGFGVRGAADLLKSGARGRLGWNKRSEDPGSVQGEGKLSRQGRLTLSSVQVQAGNVQGVGHIEWELSNNQGRISFPELKWDRSSGKAVLTRHQGAWRIDADWNRLDLGELWRHIPAGPGRRSQPEAVTMAAPEQSWPKLNVHLRAKQLLLAGGEQAEQLDAELAMELRSVRVDDWHMLQGNGEVRGSGEFLWSRRIGSGGYGGRLRVSSQDFGRFFRSLDVHHGLEGGRGEMEVSLDGFQSLGQRWVDALSGTARFRFEQGKVRRFGFVATLLGLFSLKDLPRLVVGERPDLDGSGLYYQEFSGTFAIHDSVWTIDRMKLLSPSMNVVVTGLVDFPGDRVDLLVGVRPLQILDDLVNTLPLVGKLVTGDRQSVLETQFDVTGSTHAPQATIRPVSSLAPGLLRDWINKPLEWLRKATEEGQNPELRTER